MLQHSEPVIKSFKKGRYFVAFFVTICVVLILCLNACCCAHSPSPISYRSAEKEWREGDLALRCGWSKESRAIVAKGKCSYSHIGLLHYDSISGWTVVHAVPDEDEPELLKTEPVSVFWCSERAQLGGWMRVNCNDTIAAAAVRYALQKVSDHVLFDNKFLLTDTTELYCTELVWQSYMTQGLDVTAGRRQKVPNFISAERKCIFPSDIEKSETTLFVKHLN